MRDLESAMPTGPDAPALRRLMAELQMLLHEHPVNQRRARAGAPAVNAIWLHGLGSAPQMQRSDLPAAFGAECYVRGLYKLHGQAVQPPLHTADELLARKLPRALIVADAPTLGALETGWLLPLLRAVRAGQVARLELIVDRWRIRLDRWASLKIWRRGLPLAQWPT